MSVARYSREVHLEDLNNVHTLAILTVPPGSRVLDLGAAEGSVARALVARGCDVTAVEGDAEGVSALRGHGLRTVHADLEAMAADDLPVAAFDVVLLLDVLEHLVHPDRLLALVPRWLAPGGQVLISVPNVAHAAVRLALLQGSFPRTDVGLLDRTHLQFFDRAQLEALVSGAGLARRGVLTVEREVHETELGIDLEQVPADILEATLADPQARIYQFFVIAAAGAARDVTGTLAEALQARVRAGELAYRQLETYASRVDAELLLVREARERLEAEYTRADTERHRLDEQLRTVTDAYRQLEAHAAHVEADLRARVDVERRLEGTVRTTEEAYRTLEAHARHLATELSATQEARRQLQAQMKAADHAFQIVDARAREAEAARDWLTDQQRQRDARIEALTADLAREAVARAAAEVDATYLADALADRDMLRDQLRLRMEELRTSSATHAALQRDLAVQREFAETLAAQVPRIAALGGEALVLGELERFRAVAPTPEASAAIAAEAAEFRRLQEALAIRGLARLDAWLRRRPRLRGALRVVARTMTGRRALRGT